MCLSDYFFAKVTRGKIAGSTICLFEWLNVVYVYIQIILQEYFITLPSYQQGDDIHGYYHSSCFF